ncbi:MAG: prepilin-type N-terminal cleavage/methylation domain-containing protein [Gemmataceae bacterium]|nr:prepilin-type N-terminal cleavage/methylation domain-containing protein [Gemmata sp.]MDW8198529.1 prepilin-type N-terminal cleavage/methylation domain-containing protein [Gemmataceae bacterium]
MNRPYPLPHPRGVTLVELLVVMSILVGLTALALMLLPQVTDQDRTLKATAEVQAALRSAQAMAATARLPRGVRFIARPNSLIATEMQYLEAPPVLIPDPKVLADPNGPNGPRVEFVYELYNGSEPSIDPAAPSPPPPPPPAGTVKRRHCYIVGLNPDQRAQVVESGTLVLPVLGAWSRIERVGPGRNNNPNEVEVLLHVYPDVPLGVETTYRTYHFGIYAPPIPLIGEPLVQLPENIGVDLEVSYPPGQLNKNYDIMFAPSGQTVFTATTATSVGTPANTNIFLWVRDYTQVPDMRPSSISPLVFDPMKFRRSGEQQIVGIRNGYVGTAPVLWPNDNGTYPPGQNPYSLAQQKLK